MLVCGGGGGVRILLKQVQLRNRLWVGREGVRTRRAKGQRGEGWIGDRGLKK